MDEVEKNVADASVRWEQVYEVIGEHLRVCSPDFCGRAGVIVALARDEDVPEVIDFLIREIALHVAKRVQKTLESV